MKYISPLILTSALLLAVTSCGSSDEPVEQDTDAQPVVTVQEKQNSCELYFEYMDCYVASLPEDEQPEFMTNYDDMKTKLAERSDDEANQLCTTFILTLQDNREEAQKTGCTI